MLSLCVVGSYSEELEEYELAVIASGYEVYRSTNLAVSYSYTIDHEHGQLDIQLIAWFNASRHAEKCTLTFRYDGSRFVFVQPLAI